MLDFLASWIPVPLGLVVVGSLYKAFKTARTEFYLMAVCAALQLAALYVSVPAIVVVSPILIAVLLPKPRRDVSFPEIRPIFLVSVVVLFAALTRLKGIESLAISGANDFGWETAFSYMASSSWHSAVMSGIKHHSISQGFLWHLVYFVMHTFTQDPIIGGRIFFAVLSVANILLVFLVGRRVFGNWVGVIACAIFAFSPLEPAWARSNYGMTLATATSLLVAYVTFRSSRVSQVILSGLTMFSYPAATTMGVFPLLVGLVSRSRRAILTGLAGVMLWICIPSLVVSLTEGSFSWVSPAQVHSSDRSIIDVAKRAPNFEVSLATSLSNNIQSFVKKIGSFSDGDEYFVLSALKPKYLLGRIVLIFLPVGLYLIRGTRAGPALLVWLGLSLITAVTSLDVIPRRFCTFVAPISIVSGYGAAVAVASLWRPVWIVLVTTAACGALSFATYFHDLRAPYLFSTTVVGLVEKELQGNTLVLLDDIPAPCAAWIFNRLRAYAEQGSYISYNRGSAERPLELTNEMAKEMAWYRDTSLQGTVTAKPVSRIVLFSSKGEPPAHLAPGLSVTDHSTTSIDWFTLHKFVIEKAPS